MPTNDHKYNHGATRIDPDPTMVDQRLRPHPQSTTIHPDSFKRFENCRSVVGEVPESPRFFMIHYGTATIHADVSTVLLPIMPMHPDLMNRGES